MGQGSTNNVAGDASFHHGLDGDGAISSKIKLNRWTVSSLQTLVADVLVVLMAIALPWSTTAFGICAGLWLFAFAAISKPGDLWELFKIPQCALPISLFGLCLVGMLWSEATLTAGFHATGTFVKLLAIPLLIYQFERSSRGVYVFVAFLVSCTALLILSWLNWFAPETILFSTQVVGVPVKNWITQGVEFVLCIFGLATWGIIAWQGRRFTLSVALGLLSLLFLFNLVFVVSSRAALVSLPFLFLVATYRYIDRRWLLVLYGLTALAVVAAWYASPNLRGRLESLPRQFMQYENGAALRSVGLRIEYWTKSLKFMQEAPIIGHGTGSIKSLFEQDAQGKVTQSSEIVANPHNQTLYCGIQWGIIGIFLLITMWAFHLSTFVGNGWVPWIGLLTVLQNIFSSLFNSHITDFVEGWIYVLGVGIATGMVFRSYRRTDDAGNL